MGFTGSLILARSPVSLLDMDLLAPHEAELVGSNDDHWQLAAVIGDFPDIPGLAAALAGATTAPVLIAVIDDSDTALLLADSHDGHRWITVLNAPADSAGRAVRCREIACVQGVAERLVGGAVVAVGLAQRRQDGIGGDSVSGFSGPCDSGLRDRGHCPGVGDRCAWGCRVSPGHRFLVGASRQSGTRAVPVSRRSADRIASGCEMWLWPNGIPLRHNHIRHVVDLLVRRRGSLLLGRGERETPRLVLCLRCHAVLDQLVQRVAHRA
jgi:hypothetical protein